MSNPLPNEIILPSGESAYLNPYTGRYSRSRQYAQRMQRNYARGISQSAARGHSSSSYGAESRARREREQQKYGDELTPTQRFYLGFQQRYGFSYRYWRKLWRNYIAEINSRALPNPHSNRMIVVNGQRKDPRVFPIDVAAIKQLYDGGYRDPVYPDARTWEDWIELRLGERLYAIREFQDFHNAVPGRSEYQNRSSTWLNVNLFGGSAGPPIELWWYH